MKGMTMKRLFALTLVAGLSTGIFSQSLNGSYTIGGNTPDFATLQEAADTLEVNGVSGPVFFNVRPGIYMKNNGNNTVLILDGIVPGLSAENRVTFQPDDNAGGNADNVILQMNIDDPNTANSDLVRVSLNYVTFHNLTFQEADASQHIGFSKLVNLLVSSFNVPVIGIVIDGCKFVGSAPFGTENGIELAQAVRDIAVRGNIFLRLLRGISGMNTWFLEETLTIEDNQFLAGWRSTTGAGSHIGAAMEVHGENLIIKRNIIDFEGSINGGYLGIFLLTNTATETIIVEQNSVKGSVVQALTVSGGGILDSFVIANNMININAFGTSNAAAAGIIIDQNTKNAKILFNTIVVHGGFSLYGLYVDAENCVVLNNIIIAKASAGFSACYSQGASTIANLQSDYNVIFTTNNILVLQPGVSYANLGAYQTATGLDTNSISKDIDFIDSTNLHISDCQAQDPDLKGIPVAGILVDIDEEIRSTTTPMIGADENSFTSFQMFSDPYRAELPGTAFDIAADNFDNLLYDGIAVPDYDNRQVLLYHNLPPRSFELDNILPTSFKPIVVKFYDLDEDNNLDLIVGGDTSAVQVFWGDGIGGFSTPVTVGTFGRVRSLEPGPTFSSPIQRTIAITEDNGIAPTESVLGYLMHLGNRDLCHDVQYGLVGGFYVPPDTVHAGMTDFVFGELAGDGDFPEFAAVTVSPLPHPLIVISDLFFVAITTAPCVDIVPTGTINEIQVGSGVGSTAGHSNIVMGDFDGDTDLDLITLETFSSVLLIKNQGNLDFTSESISVSGAMGLASMDYEIDGDLDFITVNDQLQTNGITVFLNDGTGGFTSRENCFFPFATGLPRSVVASDFDQDGKTDIAIVSSVAAGVDSLFVLYNLGGGTVGIQDQEIVEIPTSHLLSQNFPNPFNPTTTIKFSIPVASVVTLKIYNILGEEVKTLVNEYKEIGNHTTQFDASSLSSGIYLYRMKAGSFVETKKMILIK